jgi:thymidylate synthase
MHSFSFITAGDALYGLGNELIKHGEDIAPRGQPTKELRDVLIRIEDSSHPLCTDMGRKMNMSLAAMEAVQLVGGYSDPALLERIAPNTKQFQNAVGGFDGAYGPRISASMPFILGRLVSDSTTRQAVVPIWSHWDSTNPSKDLPCTLSFTFSIRNDQLLLSTHMRSNDIWWGWTYDVVQFTQLQWSVANMLGIPAGPYMHYVNSLHAYERDFAAIAELRRPKSNGKQLFGFGRQREKSWAFLEERVQGLTVQRIPIPRMSLTERWAYDLIAPRNVEA